MSHVSRASVIHDPNPSPGYTPTKSWIDQQYPSRNLLFYRRKEEDYLKATDFLQPRFVITRTNLLSGVQNNRVTQQIIVVTPAIIKHERYLVTTLLE